MGTLWIWKGWSPVLLASVLFVVSCLADKDPSIQLRAPLGPSPVFSASIEGIPVSSGSQQKNVYSKGPSIVHSSALASASAGGGGGGGSEQQRNNNNNNPWYTPDYSSGAGDSGGSGTSLSFSGSNSGGSSSGGYYEQQQPPPQQTSTTSDSYSPGGGQQQQPAGPQYAYYYQHYPNSGQSQPGGGAGWSMDDGGSSGLLGGFDLPGGGGGGIAGLKVAKIAAAIVKGVLVVKPFLILILLALIAFPVLLFLAPIPIITITGPPTNGNGGGTTVRMGRSSQLTSYLTQLSGKVLNSEECLERILCKMPQPPEKYQKKVRFVWDEYGSKMVTNARVNRGLNAYFEQNPQKNKNLKCNQRFKCSNKYL